MWTHFTPMNVCTYKRIASLVWGREEVSLEEVGLGSFHCFYPKMSRIEAMELVVATASFR